MFWIGLIVAFFVAILLGPFILMIAWNAVMPAIFSLPTITIWQALGMILIVTTLTSAIKIVIGK